LRDHLHRLGFGKTYYGWPHHLGDFEVELGTVAADRPNARFVVIGYGTGARAARDLVVFADTIGVPIDTVIYLEPVGLDVVAVPPPPTPVAAAAPAGAARRRDAAVPAPAPGPAAAEAGRVTPGGDEGFKKVGKSPCEPGGGRLTSPLDKFAPCLH